MLEGQSSNERNVENHAGNEHRRTHLSRPDSTYNSDKRSSSDFQLQILQSERWFILDSRGVLWGSIRNCGRKDFVLIIVFLLPFPPPRFMVRFGLLSLLLLFGSSVFRPLSLNDFSLLIEFLWGLLQLDDSLPFKLSIDFES